MIDRNSIRRLYETVGSDTASLLEMFDCFFEETPTLVQQIASSAHSGEHDVLRRCAHSLKSNARDFGACGLADLCARLEQDLRQGAALPDAEARAALIVAEWQKAEVSLREIASEWEALQ